LQMWLWDWIGDYPDPQDWTSLQFGKGAGNNAPNYGQNHSNDAAKQQGIQQLLAQADANTGNPSERIKQYQQAEQQLVDDVAWIPVYQQTVTYGEKPCVVGPTSNTFDIVPTDDWGSIYKSTATPCADVSAYK